MRNFQLNIGPNKCSSKGKKKKLPWCFKSIIPTYNIIKYLFIYFHVLMYKSSLSLYSLCFWKYTRDRPAMAL